MKFYIMRTRPRSVGVCGGNQIEGVFTDLDKAIGAANHHGTEVSYQPGYGNLPLFEGRDVIAMIPCVVIDEYDTDDATKYNHGNIMDHKRVWPKAKDIKLFWLGSELKKSERRKDRYPGDCPQEML